MFSKELMEIKIMMNEYRKMGSEELVQAVGGLSAREDLIRQDVPAVRNMSDAAVSQTGTLTVSLFAQI